MALSFIPFPTGQLASRLRKYNSFHLFLLDFAEMNRLLYGQVSTEKRRVSSSVTVPVAGSAQFCRFWLFLALLVAN